MLVDVSQKRSGEITRQRILEAALNRFTKASYEEVRLRDIAMEVGVDVALVHRSFGSKEQLFAEVLRIAAQSQLPTAVDKENLIIFFSSKMFESEGEPETNNMLQIFVHSLSSPQAREALRSSVNDFIKAFADRIDEDGSLQRAAVFVACLAGIHILRDILRIEPLLDKVQGQPLVKRVFDASLSDLFVPVSAKARTPKTSSRTARTLHRARRQ